MGVLLIGTGLALAAANLALAAQETLEEAIREALSSQGEVRFVEMAPREDGRSEGYAIVVDDVGRPRRLNCIAVPAGDEAMDWTCDPIVDQAALDDVESSIREGLADQVTVLEVEMARQDDSNMTGFARVRDENGAIVRASCTATREGGSEVFAWDCRPDLE